MRRLVVVSAVALAVLPACATQDRPEGVVERWLISLNQGPAGEPERFASNDVSELVLPRFDACEPEALDVIEVGSGRIRRLDSGVEEAEVPYRLEYASDRGELCQSPADPSAPLEGTARLGRFRGSGTWRVEELVPLDPTLRVPSRGGGHIGSAGAMDWIVGIAVGVALVGLVMLLMAAQPEPRPIPSDVASHPDARGL